MPEQKMNSELNAETQGISAQVLPNPMLAAVDVKIAELLQISDEFIFPAYYSHTGCVMWKIENVYTKWGGETLVLSPVSEGIEKALDIAIDELYKRREKWRLSQ